MDLFGIVLQTTGVAFVSQSNGRVLCVASIPVMTDPAPMANLVASWYGLKTVTSTFQND